MRVLIADDERDFARFLAAHVQACGHEVAEVVTAGGLDVIRKYSDCRPDLVLLDVVMPKFNGITVCRALLSKDPNARVVLMSGRLSAGHPLVVDSGAVGFLAKPLTREELRRTLEAHGPRVKRSDKSDASDQSDRSDLGA